MAVTPEQIAQLEMKPALVVTPTGQVVSFGVLRVMEMAAGVGGRRVDLHFETETMRCVMGVPPHRLESLLRSWDGTMYRYLLPSGDQLWLPPEKPVAPPAESPIVETFHVPVPPPKAPAQSKPAPARARNT